VPDFKMEKHQIDRRVAQMEAEGTRFRAGVNVGFDEGTTGEDLLERYDAVVLATGATVSRELPIPGRDLQGVHQAMDYLPQANRVVAGTEVPDQILATGKDVVIIGAGDTAADCLGTALRQGARSVTELAIGRRPGDDRAPDQPWPTYPTIYRVSNAHEEGGERRYDSATAELVGDGDGNVVGLRVAETEHVDGKRLPKAGTEVLIDAQLVLLAMGYVSVETPGLVEQLALEVDARGRVVRDADFATSVPGVFVAGDAGRGQSLIVWAIAEGRAAAAAVDRHLRGHTELPAPIEPTTVSIVV
jgi:glutamate synthase (NADPH) small chain